MHVGQEILRPLFQDETGYDDEVRAMLGPLARETPQKAPS